MKKVYALAFALLLSLLAVTGAQAGKGNDPSKNRLIQHEDPVTGMVRCWVCSDDMTLCVEVICSAESN